MGGKRGVIRIDSRFFINFFKWKRRVRFNLILKNKVKCIFYIKRFRVIYVVLRLLFY